MNKELILKYEKEFNHWLHGGNILAYYKKDTEPKWLTPNSENPDDPWNFSEVLIVIDDAYVEFRKATAENQIIEVARYIDGKKIYVKSNTTDMLNYAISDIRIKPDESNFKVGDWIRLRDMGTSNGAHMLKIEEIDTRNSPLGFVSLLGQGKSFHSNNVKLWTPQPDEWCWFWSDGQKIPNLRQFSNGNTHYNTKDNNLKSDFFGYEYCEPFIGALPTFLTK